MARTQDLQIACLWKFTILGTVIYASYHVFFSCRASLQRVFHVKLSSSRAPSTGCRLVQRAISSQKQKSKMKPKARSATVKQLLLRVPVQ